MLLINTCQVISGLASAEQQQKSYPGINYSACGPETPQTEKTTKVTNTNAPGSG